MTRTFDIRFAQSSGFAALLEAPTNTFRWKGAGLMRIDADGVHLAARRGLLSWFTPRKKIRIGAADLTEVYREGYELRLEFNTTTVRRAVLPLWTRDRATAAEIVRLLPTRRTIEIDESLARRRFRLDVPFVGGLLACLVLLALIVAGFFRTPAEPAASAASRVSPDSTEPAGSPQTTDGEVPAIVEAVAQPVSLSPSVALPVEARTSGAAPNDAGIEAGLSSLSELADAAVSPPKTPPAPPSGAIAFVPESRLDQLARRQLDGFQEYAAHFYVQFLEGRKTSSELAAEWSSYSQRLIGSAEFQETALQPMIDAELAASASWSQALATYADGTRLHDSAMIERARAELERAGDMTASVTSTLRQP